MENLELGIDFGVNGPEVKQQLDQVRSEITDTAKSAEVANEKVAASLTKVALANSEIGSAANAFKGITDNAREANSQLKETEDGAISLGSVLTAGLSAFGAGELVSKLVQVRGEFQQLEISFTTILQSKEKAMQLMGEIATTPINLQDAAASTKQLLGYGFSADKVVDSLKMLGNVSSGVSVPLAEVVKLYGSLKTQGNVTLADLEQFADRGIPVYDELAKSLHVSTSEINSMAAAGKIGFSEVETAFNSMTGQGGKFHNLLEDQSHSLTGLTTTLHDAIDKMFNEIGKSTEGFLSKGIEAATFFVEHYRQVGTVLLDIVTIYGAYKAAAIAYSVIQQAAVVNETAANGARALGITLLEGEAAAQAELNMAMAANPWGLVAGAVAALGMLIYNLASQTDELSEAVHDATTEYEKERTELDVLYGSLLATASGTKARKDKIEEFNKHYGNYLTNLLTEKATNEDLRKAYDEVNKSLRENINLKIRQGAIEKLTTKGSEAIGKRISNVIGKIDDPKLKGQAAVVLPALINNLASKYKDKLTNYTQEDMFRDIQEITDKWSTGDFQGAAMIEQVYRAALEKMNMDAGIKGVTDALQANIPQPKEGQNKPAPKPIRSKKVVEDLIKEKQAEWDSMDAQMRHTKKGLALEKEITRLEEERNEWNIKGQNAIAARNNRAAAAAAKRAASAANRDANKKEDFLKKVTAAEHDADQGSMVKVESEIDKVKEKYTNLIKEANKLKMGDGVLKRLENARTKELGNAQTKQDNIDFKKDLDAKKELYAQYEQAKATVGAVEASKLYRVDFENYRAYLTAKAAQAQTKEQREGTTKALVEYDKAQQAQYVQLLTTTMSYQEQKLMLEEKFNADMVLLAYAGERERMARRKSIYAEDQKNLADNHIKQLDEYKALFDHLEELSWKEVRARKAALIEKLKAEKAANIGQEAEYNRAIKNVNDLARNKHNQDFENVLQRVQGVIDKLGEMNSGIADAGALLLQAGSSYAAIQKGLDDWKDPDKQGTADKISTGLGIAGAAISVVSAGVKYFKALKESRIKALKEIADFQQKVITGEQKYQATLRQRTVEDITSQRGKSRYTIILEQLDEIKKQAPAVQAAYDKVFATLQSTQYITGLGYEHKTWLRKAKTWDIMATLYGADYDRLEELDAKGQLKDAAKANFDNLKALREELKKSGVDAVKLKQELDEMLTGTSATDLAKGLRNLFESGKKSAQDFGDSFEEIMRNAVLSSFEARFLQEAMEPFYQELTKVISETTPDEAAVQKLKEKYTALGADYANKLDEIEKITGVKVSKGNVSDDAGTLKGAYKSASQESIDLLSANTGGLRLAVVEGNGYLKGVALNSGEQLQQLKLSVFSLINIEVNTRNTAQQVSEYLPLLKDIARNTRGNNNDLKAAGL